MGPFNFHRPGSLFGNQPQLSPDNFKPNFIHEKAKETNIINESPFIQVLYPDGSEKIFKRHSLAACELVVSRKAGSDESKNKILSIDTHIRLAGFSKVKAITEEEIALACFESLL